MMITDENILVITGLTLFGGVVWWFYNQGNDMPIDTIPTDTQDNSQSDLANPFILDTNFSAPVTYRASWQPPRAAALYLPAIKAAESRYNLPVNLLARLLYQESHYRADIISGKVKSSTGAAGIAQFMPETARQFGINPLNTDQSIDAAGRYLNQLYNSLGSWDKALAGYNWGQGNVKKKGLINAPQETRLYVSQILSDLGIA